MADTVNPDIATQFAEMSARVADYKWKVKSGRKADKLAHLKQELEMDEHIIPIEQLYARLKTDPDQGLSDGDAAARLKEHGPNRLTPARTKPWWLKLAIHMFGGFSMLLWIASVLCFIGYGLTPEDPNNLYLAIVLIVVVVVTAIFSFYQENKAARKMKGFLKMIPQDALVIRSGKPVVLPTEKLVPGDVIEVKYGNKVPADVRIISAKGMKVDNSSLTGESEPQTRSPETTHDNPLETQNLAFFSTNCVEGRAKAIVLTTGDHTVIGRIAGLAGGTGQKETPIAIEIKRFIKIISTVAIVLGVIFFIFGLFVYDFITNLVFAIGIIVANVPEGLLATVTVSLTLTAQRMSRKNVIVKNLESVETLGSTSCICSDKTGTLTQNKMTVAHLWYDNQIVSTDPVVTQGAYHPEDETFRALLRIATLCNKSEFTGEGWEDLPVSEREATSDASEQALIKFAHPVSDIYEMRKANPSVAEIPFNSTNKYQLHIHRTEDPDDGRFVVLMKGAPERIISRCNRILINGEELELGDDWKHAFQDAYDALGGMGERVLGFCHLYLDEEEYPEDYVFDTDNINFPIGEPPQMVFVGLMSLIDPPRPAVPKAVKLCKEAGIKVVMVTGDHPITAKAIAKQVHIIDQPTLDEIAQLEGVKPDQVDPRRVKAIVIHGSQLNEMDADQLGQVLLHEQIVFARTSPQQKLRIVEGCQKLGHVVAVTGDGVNDSPALKRADIGIAMGIAGSDVSKEAANMILMDDNFASIVAGVKEGRIIFDNLKKSIAYTLSSNIPEIGPFILFIVIQIPLPLTTVLILCIDLGTDMLPAISLAYERAEADIMKRRPRNSKTDSLVTAKLISYSYLQIGMMQVLAAHFTWLVVMGDYGFKLGDLVGSVSDYISDDDDFETDDGVYDADYREDALRHAQSAYFVAIVIVQIADILICKTRKLSVFQQGMRNYVLNFGIFTEIVLACIILYVPGLSTGLGTMGIRWVHWLPAIPWAFLIFFYDEIRKWLIRRYPGGWVERVTYY